MSVVMLEIDQLSCAFNGVKAVDGINLDIHKGEFIAIMGPSGCGKTTTLRLLAGLEKPTAGTISLWGRRIDTLDPWEREAPLVWQNYALFPFLNVRQNIEFGMKQKGVATSLRKARTDEWMGRLGIDMLADRPVTSLSGGQKQRVAIARALVTEPEMLLLDEPLSALDPHLRVRMQAELTDLHKRLGITFIYITHSQSEAFAMADRVAIMNAGRIEQIGEPRVIYRRPQTRFVAEFLGGNNVIDGTVKALGDNSIVLDGSFGALEVSAEPDQKRTGAPQTAVVPADIVGLAQNAVAGMNNIECTVRTVELAGASVTVFLALDNGEELRAQRPVHELETAGIVPGQRLHAYFPARDAFLLPS